MSRYTPLSNGFSRQLENHAAATALNYFAYNFITIHRTLRMSPAMAAGVMDRPWDVNDLAPWEAYEQRRAEKSGIAMQDKKERWLELCALAAVEQDPQKLTALVKEINDLLEAKERRLGILPPKEDSK
jgi:hypothetical protein